MNVNLPPIVQACMIPALQNFYVPLQTVTSGGASAFVLNNAGQYLLNSARPVSAAGNISCQPHGNQNPGETYDSRYESDLIRGVEDPRPWDLNGIIKSHIRSGSILLDIGSGTSFKLPPLAAYARWVVGLEPNISMIAKSLENLAIANTSNVTIIQGICEEIPFVDESFDIVTCMLAPHYTAEIHRVLKPGGIAILEKLGDRDKWELTRRFGSDAEGTRARFGNMRSGERAEFFKREFGQLFERTEIRNEFWTTYYTIEGLKLLLEIAPTVRNYDPGEDAHIFDEIKSEMQTEFGIPLQQNRILIVARK
jgi:SAM-dependent methyltransferase